MEHTEKQLNQVTVDLYKILEKVDLILNSR